jgi:hypothetical protein
MPFRPVDRRHLSYSLIRATTQPADAREMSERAREWKYRLETGENAPMPKAPGTRPASGPAMQGTKSE